MNFLNRAKLGLAFY